MKFEMEVQNDSYSFFGPMEMAFDDDANALDESDSVKIFLSVFMGVCMVLSIVGNVCIFAVLARDRKMRTTTNCYLLNLAITDFMMALFIPINIYFLWIPDFYPLGTVGCYIEFFLWDCLSNCSVLTIAAFTIERYLVVSKPFLRQKLILKSRVYKIIACNWIISCSFSVPDMFTIGLLQKKKHSYCFFTLSGMLKAVMNVEICVFFVLPMTIIAVLYLLIALKLKSAQPMLRSSPATNSQSKDKAVKMLAAVAALFFFCWFPFSILRVMMIGDYDYEEYYDTWRTLNYVCSCNVYISTAVNPILYSLMSRKFRQAFKDFLKGRNFNKSRTSTMTAVSGIGIKY